MPSTFQLHNFCASILWCDLAVGDDDEWANIEFELILFVDLISVWRVQIRFSIESPFLQLRLSPFRVRMWCWVTKLAKKKYEKPSQVMTLLFNIYAISIVFPSLDAGAMIADGGCRDRQPQSIIYHFYSVHRSCQLKSSHQLGWILLENSMIRCYSIYVQRNWAA